MGPVESGKEKTVIPFGLFDSPLSEFAVWDIESLFAACADLLNIALNTLDMSRRENNNSVAGSEGK